MSLWGTGFFSMRPIGIFDSGIGGLTVARAIARRLPNEQLIYFGDTAHLPYGDKSADAIRYYALKIVKYLLEQQCKMIVIACNSASTAAYGVLLEFFKEQALFVNVVDPLVEAAAKENFSKLGLIATKATVNSGVYEQQLYRLRPDMPLHALATPLLAPMIEEGFIEGQISHTILENYLNNPRLQGIDGLLLACTHYPLIRPQIEAFYQGQVKVLDATDVVAEEVARQLSRHHLFAHEPSGPHRFYVSDYTPSFEETTRLFYGKDVHLEHLPIW